MKKKSTFVVVFEPLFYVILILILLSVYMMMEITPQKNSLDEVDISDSWREYPSPRVHYHRNSSSKIGFLTSKGLSDPVILPLFGEQAPNRRHRWNYHTMNDTQQRSSSVKLPIMFKDRDCMDEVACDEVYGGDIMRVHGYEQPFVVHVY